MLKSKQGSLCFHMPLLIILCMSAGCSIHPVRTVMVSSENLGQSANRPLAKAGSPVAGAAADHDWNSQGHITQDTQPENAYRLKYHPSYSRNHWIVVEGELNDQNVYPVVLDTGASPPFFVNDIHITENALPIRPIADDIWNTIAWGKCRLPRLRIGDIVLLNWPGVYQARHMEVQLFGLPIARGDALIAGLPTLQKFKYIVLNSTAKQAQLSLSGSFEPDPSHTWAQYPFVIEQADANNAFLFVTIPIAGQETQLQLDTGSGRGLAVAEGLWREIQQRIPAVRLREAKDLYPYIGWLDCSRAVLAELRVGNRIIRNAQVSVFPNRSPLMDRCRGLLGMQYFRDTTVALDFERNLLWVKGTRK